MTDLTGQYCWKLTLIRATPNIKFHQNLLCIIFNYPEFWFSLIGNPNCQKYTKINLNHSVLVRATNIKYHENLLIHGNIPSGSTKGREFLDWRTVISPSQRKLYSMELNHEKCSSILKWRIWLYLCNFKLELNSQKDCTVQNSNSTHCYYLRICTTFCFPVISYIFLCNKTKCIHQC
jgi:hypothetical protein